MRIVILSDTHGLLRPQVLDYLAGADAIIHAGDINTPAVLERLKGFAPLYIVRGNNDKEWAAQLPISQNFTLGGVRFFLIHNQKELPVRLPEVDFVIYGHSHRYTDQERAGVRWLNLAVMELREGECQVEKISIPHSEEG